MSFASIDGLWRCADGCHWIDARFEVLGAPYSLLSVSLSASQKLYTRRGTLVGVSGKAENVSINLASDFLGNVHCSFYP